MVRIAAIGEVMVELAPHPIQDNSTDKELMALSFAGDTYNTSVYMARLGLETEYVTNLGDDAYSQKIIQKMADENIHTSMIQRLAGRNPGLYIIRNTEDGEREFFYWRKDAPARELFSTAKSSAALFEKLKTCDCVYVSGITLAIISKQTRENFFDVIKKLREKNITIAFDSNYRPRLWTSKGEAQQTMLQMLTHTDIALLTLDDEFLLWGDNTIDGCKARYADCNLRELILKRGAHDAVIVTKNSQQHIPVPKVDNVIDTTGAGDSFNAGYLAARLQDKSAEAAVQHGIRCASIIIQHRGAVIPKNIFEKEISLR